MSYTTTYRLYRTKVSQINEHHNGWGSGPLVWDYLGDRYIAEKPVYSLDREHMKKVWALAFDSRLAAHERVALCATFDWSYAETKFLNEAADLLEKFYEESSAALPDRVNHWGSIAADYRMAAKSKDRRLLGVCIECTSVSDIWLGYPKHGKPWSYLKDVA